MFEDTKHLVQSAVDGYNVCIFAYGQTGSGKTFTIYGTDAQPGLTPRGIQELFHILDRDSGKYTFSVSCFMLELYQDDLQDLLLPVAPSRIPQKVWHPPGSPLVSPVHVAMQDPANAHVIVYLSVSILWQLLASLQGLVESYAISLQQSICLEHHRAAQAPAATRHICADLLIA